VTAARSYSQRSGELSDGLQGENECWCLVDLSGSGGPAGCVSAAGALCKCHRENSCSGKVCQQRECIRTVCVMGLVVA
jgi:hypothetical protein